MILFRNPGLIPLDAVITMGVNVKVNENAIGHFGTGLKIAIASILRLGGKISIYRGRKEYRFYTKKKQVRGKEFEFVMMEGSGLPQQLAMTTELGKNWRPWMVMRELESNCRDEAGTSFQAQSPSPFISNATTTVVVECAEVEEAWHKRHEYFITGEPIEIHPRIEVYKGSSKAYFYRGIKVGEFQGSLPFTFNLTDDFTRYLSEDRALGPYYAMQALESHIPELKRADVIEALFPDARHVNGEEESFIFALDFDQQYTSPSPAFFARMKYLNKVNVGAVSSSMFKLLVSHGAVDRHASMTHYELTPIEQIMLNRAKQYILDLGYGDITSMQIFKTDLGKEAHAMAIPGEEKIYLAPSAFDSGQKFLCSTLHEEYLHVRYGLADTSRGMQQHLFDRIATIMEEHFYKEPI